MLKLPLSLSKIKTSKSNKKQAYHKYNRNKNLIYSICGRQVEILNDHKTSNYLEVFYYPLRQILPHKAKSFNFSKVSDLLL